MEVFETADVTEGARREKELHRVAVSRHQQMQLQAIEIPFLAGNIAAIDFVVIEFGMRNTIVIADRNRKAIQAIDRIRIKRFPGFTEDPDQGEQQVADPV